ncbi:hypothetical protein K458DRAFT_393354 [Lentithecium fluviatile CBS 122367]|uniref:Uncharacterized protein n=1 Tax=Lentithecium fluviatile CBS 122367 TaxID=1168545 RepID=A0A6G1IQ61_9PLEO|nr:hypothetical protein K458DRAFT_393354 [Lentithecium fluviatile CBS 122367]
MLPKPASVSRTTRQTPAKLLPLGAGHYLYIGRMPSGGIASRPIHEMKSVNPSYDLRTFRYIYSPHRALRRITTYLKHLLLAISAILNTIIKRLSSLLQNTHNNMHAFTLITALLLPLLATAVPIYTSRDIQCYTTPPTHCEYGYTRLSEMLSQLRGQGLIVRALRIHLKAHIPLSDGILSGNTAAAKKVRRDR